MENKFAKLYEIINCLQEDEINKIPIEIRDYIKNNKATKNEFRFKTYKSFEEQGIEDDVSICFAYLSKYYSDGNFANLNLKLYSKDYALLNKIIKVEKQYGYFDIFTYNLFVSTIESIALSIKPIEVTTKLCETDENSNDFEMVVYKKSFVKTFFSKLVKLFKKNSNTVFDE